MMVRTLTAAAAFVFASMTSAGEGATQIRYYPGDDAIVIGLSGAGTPPDIRSVVLHNVAIVNGGNAAVRIGSLTISLWHGDQVVQTQYITEAALGELAKKWHARQTAGLLAVLDPILRTSQFMANVVLADSTSLAPGEGLLITQQLCVFRGDADRLVVTAHATDGREMARKDVALRTHRSPNSYRFPLDGRWFIGAAPSLHSHHRWAPLQEFAVDTLKIGDGGATHGGDGTDINSYFAFGAAVRAAASGKVLAVADGAADGANLPKPGESADASAARIASMQGELLGSGMGALIGNHVIIDHGNGEYGYYAHLRRGSVRVAVGDKVEPGQRIAELGNSGNSTQPHLHFHIADGPDPALARSLPVTFANIVVFEGLDGGTGVLESGYLIDTIEAVK